MCVFDVCVVDKNVASYEGKHPHCILSQHEHRKKGKYIEDRLERLRHFTPLVFSVNGIMGEEKKAETKKLAAALSKKQDRKY